MGSGWRAASEKCSWNEGLAHVPAMFGPDNPVQLAAVRHPTKHELAAGKREILSLARLSALQGRAKPPDRPLQTLPARRMVPPTHRLDDAAEQPCLQVAAQAGESGSVDGRPAGLVERQQGDRGTRQFAVADRPFDAAARVRERGRPTRPQPRPFEARIDIRGVIQPLYAAREKRGREPGARYAEQRAQQAHL